MTEIKRLTDDGGCPTCRTGVVAHTVNGVTYLCNTHTHDHETASA